NITEIQSCPTRRFPICRVDIRSDAFGRPHFLEVNPLAGLNPHKSDLVIMARLAGWTYETLLGRILDSCLPRIGRPRHAATVPATDRKSTRLNSSHVKIS